MSVIGSIYLLFLSCYHFQEADEELKKLAPSYSKATVCESTLKVINEAIAELRDEMRSVSNSDAAATGMLPSQSGGQKSATTGIEKVNTFFDSFSC